MDLLSPPSFWNRLSTPLCLKPTFWVQPPALVIRSSWLEQALGLFSYRKEVVVDADRQVIRWHRRVFWFFHRSREIPFANLRRIDYGFRDGLLGLSRVSVEFYTIRLVLWAPKDETVPLFSFVGEYSAPANWTDLLLHGPEALRWGSEGGQAGDSLRLVQLLQDFTKAPLV